MKKSTKILSILVAVVIVLLLVFIGLLNSLDTQRPQNIEYPKSMLSSSLFDSQNTVYTSNNNLKNVHSLKNLPYTIDIPEAIVATVGNGTIYNWSDSYYIYITEFLKTEDYYDYIRTEFCKALLMDYKKELTVIENVMADAGYINGFSAKYVVDRIVVTNEIKNVSAYYTGYHLVLDDKSDYDIFIGIATLKESTQNYTDCKSILDAMVDTIQYDKKIQEKIQDEVEKKQKEQSQIKAQLEKEKEKSEQGEGEISIDYDEIATNIQKDYEKATLTFEWNSGEEIVISLSSPDREKIYYPSTITRNTAVFRLEKIKAGIYTFEIIGETGEYSVKLYADEDGIISDTQKKDKESMPDAPSSITNQNMSEENNSQSGGGTENGTSSLIGDGGIVVSPNSQDLVSPNEE